MDPSENVPSQAGKDDERAMSIDRRIDYSAIVDRPPLRLPGSARLVVWPVVNVEEWELSRPMPRQYSNPPGGVAMVPDTQNWTWHEYGMRVGIWRLMDVFEKHAIKPTLSINAKVCETRPRIAEAAAAAGWEFMAHCYVQMPIHKIEDQRAMIRQSLQVLKASPGRLSGGWLGPGRGQTPATLDYVAEAGFQWFGDWVLDDQPLYVRTTHGPIVSIPYSVELNDITIMLNGQHESDAMCKRVCDAFDQLYSESAHSARVMAFGVHPYISGAAHRIRFLDQMLKYMSEREGVVFWQGDQINAWYRQEAKTA
ncbi:MAG: polysaccharide deacetylase family protein [Burkholderiaceae bacterium]